MAVRGGAGRGLALDEPSRTRWISAWENVCIWKNSPSPIAVGISSIRRSRMSSATRAFVTITSTAGIRPPSARGSSRWLITPRSTPESTETTCSCFSGAKNSTMRLTVSAASIVCSVEKTRWPDSAAWSATCAVSASRSSPMRMTSGSWRSTRLSACSKLSVSTPTSRWLTMQPWSRWRYSIGSSIVTMCCARVRLTWSMIAASVVVFPEPVAPVTSTRPRCSSARRDTPAGRWSSSKPAIVEGTMRKANEHEPRWRKAFTRKRGRPTSTCAMSSSPVSSNCCRRRGASTVTWSRIDSRCVSLSASKSAIGVRRPSKRKTGGCPSLKWTSLAPASTALRSTAFRSMASVSIGNGLARLYEQRGALRSAISSVSS